MIPSILKEQPSPEYVTIIDALDWLIWLGLGNTYPQHCALCRRLFHRQASLTISSENVKIYFSGHFRHQIVDCPLWRADFDGVQDYWIIVFFQPSGCYYCRLYLQAFTELSLTSSLQIWLLLFLFVLCGLCTFSTTLEKLDNFRNGSIEVFAF